MKTVKKYLWLWEFVAVALLLIVGIVAKFVDGALLTIVGTLIVVFAALRLIPLFKTTFDKLLKWIYVLEIVANFAIGVLLIYIAIKEKSLEKLFGYLVGAVLYARGLIFFFAVSLRKEETDRPKFLAHIIFFTLGTWIIAKGGFDESYLGWIVLALALLSAIFVGYSGYGNYRKYRSEIAAKQITKKVQENKIEAPTADEINNPENVPTEKDNTNTEIHA